MTAPDHAIKLIENILRDRGHPYMDTGFSQNARDDKELELVAIPSKRDAL